LKDFVGRRKGCCLKDGSVERQADPEAEGDAGDDSAGHNFSVFFMGLIFRLMD
jgi:hypothetical protein